MPIYGHEESIPSSFHIQQHKCTECIGKMEGIRVTHSWKPACADCNYKWSENSSSSATGGLTMFKEYF